MNNFVCTTIGHDWGQWGAAKPNDEGVVLSYRRCQRCNQVEGRQHARAWPALQKLATIAGMSTQPGTIVIDSRMAYQLNTLRANNPDFATHERAIVTAMQRNPSWSVERAWDHIRMLKGLP